MLEFKNLQVIIYKLQITSSKSQLIRHKSQVTSSKLPENSARAPSHIDVPTSVKRGSVDGGWTPDRPRLQRVGVRRVDVDAVGAGSIKINKLQEESYKLKFTS